MGYRVKNPDGELSFASLYDVERAYAHGLVEAEDELYEDGKPGSRKIGSIPALRQARPPPASLKGIALPWVVGSLIFGGWALFELVRGHGLRALVLCLLATAIGFGLTQKAFKRKR